MIAVWFIAMAGSVAALVQAYLFYKAMIASDPGNARMQEIAGLRAGGGERVSEAAVQGRGGLLRRHLHAAGASRRLA